MQARVAAPAQEIATDGMVDIAAVDLMTAKAGGGGDMWVGANGTKAEVATSDAVAIRHQQRLHFYSRAAFLQSCCKNAIFVADFQSSDRQGSGQMNLTCILYCNAPDSAVHSCC
jgi:hypothetical protein